jgi:hypothetical protein
MTTIAYDLPVRDFIEALDATGHVTHTQHRKSKITFHHNGGRLSHEGVLSVWQVRPASAHFNFDVAGSCAQFVRLPEYAWATGSTIGNQQSISFEMANLTLGPEWNVAEITWRRAARLAGWIHARVFGWRPTRESIVVHHYWSATTCAGPYIDKVYNQILAVAQASYDAFASGGAPEGDDMPSKDEFMAWMTEWYIYRSRPKGGRATWEDGPTEPEMLTTLQTKLDILHNEVSDDEANIIAVIRQQGGSLTAEQQAELIKSRLDQSVWLAVAKLARGEQNA